MIGCFVCRLAGLKRREWVNRTRVISNEQKKISKNQGLVFRDTTYNHVPVFDGAWQQDQHKLDGIRGNRRCCLRHIRGPLVENGAVFKGPTFVYYPRNAL